MTEKSSLGLSERSAKHLCPGCGAMPHGAIVKRERTWHLDCWAEHLEAERDALLRELRDYVVLAPKRETTGERLSATEMAVAILNWIDKRLKVLDA